MSWPTLWNWIISNVVEWVPWLLSLMSVAVSIRVARISKDTQELVSNKSQQVALIDNELAMLRDDMIRFYSAQANTDARTHIGLSQVAYYLLCANPISDESIKAAAYKVLELDNAAVYQSTGREVSLDDKVQGMTSKDALDELGDAYIKIVKQNKKSEESSPINLWF